MNKINHINSSADKDARTRVAVREKVASIQKSNESITLEKEKEMETSVSNKTSPWNFWILHTSYLPCYIYIGTRYICRKKEYG